MTLLTRPATVAELAWIAPAAGLAHVIDSPDELVAILDREPWRVRVTDGGEAALLDRWRTHGNDCAILGLWCAPRRVPELVRDLGSVARQEGFGRLLGPLVPEEAVRPYLNGGMHVLERMLVMRADLRSGVLTAACQAAPVPERLKIRDARRDDLARLVELDAECFSDFWRYDLRTMARLGLDGHVAVADEEGVLIGYTLATVHGSDGSLGRLAVTPWARRQGVGRYLAVRALRRLVGQGVRTVVLSTQEDNVASQALYRSLGFTAAPGRLVVCASDELDPSSLGALT